MDSQQLDKVVSSLNGPKWDRVRNTDQIDIIIECEGNARGCGYTCKCVYGCARASEVNAYIEVDSQTSKESVFEDGSSTASLRIKGFVIIRKNIEMPRINSRY